MPQQTCKNCYQPFEISDEEMYTTYAPERPEIVYCEKCYLGEPFIKQAHNTRPFISVSQIPQPPRSSRHRNNHDVPSLADHRTRHFEISDLK